MATNSYTEHGLKQYFNWTETLGADSFRPNPMVIKVTRLSFFNLLHPFQTFILGKNLAPKIALKYGINLIFYGESPAEYGNGIVEFNNRSMDPDYYSLDSYDDVRLGGAELRELIKSYDLNMNDLEAFLPILKNVAHKNLQYLYLSHFVKWDPQENYYYSVKNGAFMPRPHSSDGTYTRYSSFDDKNDDLHYFTTHVSSGLAGQLMTLLKKLETAISPEQMRSI